MQIARDQWGNVVLEPKMQMLQNKICNVSLQHIVLYITVPNRCYESGCCDVTECKYMYMYMYIFGHLIQNKPCSMRYLNGNLLLICDSKGLGKN